MSQEKKHIGQLLLVKCVKTNDLLQNCALWTILIYSLLAIQQGKHIAVIW